MKNCSHSCPKPVPLALPKLVLFVVTAATMSGCSWSEQFFRKPAFMRASDSSYLLAADAGGSNFGQRPTEPPTAMDRDQQDSAFGELQPPQIALASNARSQRSAVSPGNLGAGNLGAGGHGAGSHNGATLAADQLGAVPLPNQGGTGSLAMAQRTPPTSGDWRATAAAVSAELTYGQARKAARAEAPPSNPTPPQTSQYSFPQANSPPGRPNGFDGSFVDVFDDTNQRLQAANPAVANGGAYAALPAADSRFVQNRNAPSTGPTAPALQPVAPAQLPVGAQLPARPQTIAAARAPQGAGTHRTPQTVRAEISGVQPGGGLVRIAVFESPQAFPDQRFASSKQALEATQTTVVAILPTSPNAAVVAVYQDQNGDGQLNRSRRGVPTEPYGFSNNARSKRGPPSFQAAASRLTPGAVQQIVLK